MAEVGVYECKPAVGQGVCLCVDVLVESKEPSPFPEAAEDGARMSAAAESGVHVCAFRFDVEGVECFRQECRNVI